MYEILMVKSCGIQLRHRNAVRFVGEDGVDAGGPTTELVSMIGEVFGQTDILFEKFGDSGAVCISNEATAYGGLALQHMFRFFGRYIMYVWIVNGTMPIKLSLPLLKLIKGERVSLADIKTGDEGLFKKFEYYLSLPEDEWEFDADHWQREIRTKSERQRKKTTHYSPGHRSESFYQSIKELFIELKSSRNSNGCGLRRQEGVDCSLFAVSHKSRPMAC